jgi:hypothetical protein
MHHPFLFIIFASSAAEGSAVLSEASDQGDPPPKSIKNRQTRGHKNPTV